MSRPGVDDESEQRIKVLEQMSGQLPQPQKRFRPLLSRHTTKAKNSPEATSGGVDPVRRAKG